MIKTSVTISGADKLIKRLGVISKQLEVDIKDIVEEVTIAIERQAISNAPIAGEQLATQSPKTIKTSRGKKVFNIVGKGQKNLTNINQLIGARFENNGFIGTVFVSASAGNLPIYIEFGTGSSAAGYVPSLPKWAQEIARKYYINGKGTLIKSPYLLPAYFQHSPELYRKLKDLVKRQKI